MQSLSGFWEISFEITFWQSFEEMSFHFVLGRKREKVTTERKGAGLAPFRNPTARISVFIAKSSCEEEKTAVGRLTLILIFEPLVSTVSFDATSFHSFGLLKSSIIVPFMIRGGGILVLPDLWFTLPLEIKQSLYFTGLHGTAEKSSGGGIHHVCRAWAALRKPWRTVLRKFSLSLPSEFWTLLCLTFWRRKMAGNDSSVGDGKEKSLKTNFRFVFLLSSRLNDDVILGGQTKVYWGPINRFIPWHVTKTFTSLLHTELLVAVTNHQKTSAHSCPFCMIDK